LPLITQSAVVFLLVGGVVAHIAYNERIVHDGPSIFTTCGIFFTFLGIAQGLYRFDPNQIDTSLPLLLEGLKTAVFASVVGVGIAITIKLRFAFLGVAKKGQKQKIQGATVDDLYNQLIAVEHSIVGQDDSTLLTQLRLTRQDTNDRLDRLQRSHVEFAKQLAENNSKALIQALREVIRDFNTKISEQFGENFKQLNIAVGRLLTWQDNYRNQLSEAVSQQSRTAESMAIATERYAVVVSNAETFGVLADQLSHLLTGLETQRNHLHEALKSLGQLLTTASGSLPQIESKIVQLTEQVTFGVKQNNDEMTKVVRDNGAKLREVVADVSAALLQTAQKANQQLNEHMEQNQNEVTKMIHEQAVRLQEVVGDTKAALLETTQTANRQLNDHMRQLSDKTTEQLVTLDKALELELSKSISSLGRQLTALSSRFVEDYSPLTEKLRVLVQSSRGG
ncbi:MAG: hypothetical protein WBQ24_24870, partial [Xanthobacteraceae bacterium]